MSNVAKLQKALESIDGMTDAEYEILYKSAKQADDNLVSIENYDEIIARNQEVLTAYENPTKSKEIG